MSARKQMVGQVLSDRMTKTIVVQVERLVRHPVYQRVIRLKKKFKVHDPGGQAHVGDEVRIEETRPLSKEKRWRLVEILRKGREIVDKEAQRIEELEAVGVMRHKPTPSVSTEPPSGKEGSSS